MPEVTYLEALRQGLWEEMERDERVFILGEDVGLYGGAFKVTEGFTKRFGEQRVIDTSISEAAIVGAAAGAAHMGMRPVAEMQFIDFISCAYDMLTNYVATARYRAGLATPIVVRGPCGGYVRGGPFHSQNPEAAFSPHSALRPRSMAIVRMNAAASFSTLRMLSLSMPPPTDTGWAAPMFVAGAMAATWAAMVMKTPAEAARAPVGPTHTTTGISALSRRWQIARIERSRPPGVSSWMTSACAPPAFARVSALSMRRSVTGLMTPSMTTVATGAGAADAGAAASRTSATRTRTPWARRLIDRRGGPRYGPPASSSEGGYAPLGLPRPSLGRAPAHPGRASGLTQDVSSAEREDAHELEHEVGGQQRGDLAGPVVGRRDFDDVGAHQRVAGQRAHERERLERREPADLRRAGGRRVRRVDGVDVERAVDGTAAQPRQPLGRPRRAVLLDRLDAEHLQAALVVEREVLGPVERSTDPDLDHAAAVHRALLDRAAERRAVEELAAEVLVPGVGMRVEVHDAERAVAAGQR